MNFGCGEYRSAPRTWLYCIASDDRVGPFPDALDPESAFAAPESIRLAPVTALQELLANGGRHVAP